MSIFQRLAAFLASLVDGVLGGLFRALFEGLTGRNLDAEQAERDHAEDHRLKAELAQAELETRHEETLAAAAAQAAELRAMRREMAVLAERRARHEGYRCAHDAAGEVRSSRWTPEPEPESGAPMAPAPAY